MRVLLSGNVGAEVEHDFIGQVSLLTADLISAEEVRLDLDLKTRGNDSDIGAF